MCNGRGRNRENGSTLVHIGAEYQKQEGGREGGRGGDHMALLPLGASSPGSVSSPSHQLKPQQISCSKVPFQTSPFLDAPASLAEIIVTLADLQSHGFLKSTNW